MSSLMAYDHLARPRGRPADAIPPYSGTCAGCARRVVYTGNGWVHARSATRYAIVTTGQPDAVAAYLPRGYEVRATVGDKVYIVGEDDAGWTLDDYVIPRLASGLHAAEEVVQCSDCLIDIDDPEEGCDTCAPFHTAPTCETPVQDGDQLVPCGQPSIGRRSFFPGSSLREVCAKHEAQGRAAVAKYEREHKARYGPNSSPWS